MGIIKFPTNRIFLTPKSCVAINYGLCPFAKACWITFQGNNSVPARATTVTWKPDSMAWRKDWILVIACEWRWQSLPYLCMLHASNFQDFSHFHFRLSRPNPDTWTTAWRKDSILVDAHERRWQSLLCLCQLHASIFKIFINFIFNCPGPRP